MLCFEVYRNGEKLCTAGIGDFGVLTAILSWVSHEPEKLKQWAASGITETEPTKLEFSVGGLGRCVGDAGAHLKWVQSELAVGDEIRIRIVDVASGDPPRQRYEDNPALIEEQRKAYVLNAAQELGWKIITGADEVGAEPPS